MFDILIKCEIFENLYNSWASIILSGKYVETNSNEMLFKFEPDLSLKRLYCRTFSNKIII